METKKPETTTTSTTRREFLRRTAGAATVAGIASVIPRIAQGSNIFGLSFPHVSRRRVLGANDRIGVGFIGCGGRQWAHLGSVQWLKTQKKVAVELVAAAEISSRG